MKSIFHLLFGSKGPRYGMKRGIAVSCSVFLTFLFLHCSAIISFALTVTSPNGGERLASSADWNIQWDNPEGAATFKSFYSVNNRETWKLIFRDLMATEYIWNVPLQKGNELGTTP